MAHATQVDPTSKFWFGLPARGAWRPSTPHDDYELARSMVDGKADARRLPEGEIEDDLFAAVGAMSDR